MEQEKKHKLTKEELIVILQNKRKELNKDHTKKNITPKKKAATNWE